MTRTLSLCSGAGGLEMAFPRADVLALAEIDPAASLVLGKRYPGVTNLGDITFRWPGWDELHQSSRPDLILAGVPCQPVSEGGFKLGAADPRWLGAAFLEKVRLFRPAEVFLENVERLAAPACARERGEILDGLHAMNYSVRWGVMGACAIGAPHCRHRFYLHASLRVEGWHMVERVPLPPCARNGRSLLPSPRAGDGIRGAELARATRTGTGGTLADWVARSRVDPDYRGSFHDTLQSWADLIRQPTPVAWEPARTLSGVRLAAPFSEWLMGWPAGWVTDAVGRADALRIIGNGVVPRAAARAYALLEAAH